MVNIVLQALLKEDNSVAIFFYFKTETWIKSIILCWMPSLSKKLGTMTVSKDRKNTAPSLIVYNQVEGDKIRHIMR